MGSLIKYANPFISYNWGKQPGYFPPDISIETINVCNIDCVMCPITKRTGPKTVMQMDTFRRIIDECAANDCDVTLHNYGEPYLDPFIFERIQYCKTKGVFTAMSTNAMLLNEERAHKTIESGLGVLTISFDGFTKQTYESVRVGGNFDTVLANTQRMLGLKEEMQSASPIIQLQIIRMNATESEIGAFVDFWSGKDAVVRVNRFDTRAGQVDRFSEMAGKDGLARERNRPPCAHLWKQFIILANGDVVPCCEDYAGKMGMGNINEKSIGEIWRGERYMALRKAHMKRAFLGLCRDCIDYPDTRPTKILLNGRNVRGLARVAKWYLKLKGKPIKTKEK